MPAITEQALRKYFRSLLEVPRIQDFLNECRKKHAYKLTRSDFIVETSGGELILPKLRIVDSAGVRYAGLAHTDMSIDMSRWILVDGSQAKAVLRHELAHLLHYYSKLGDRPHGKTFRMILKVVSPRTWRQDTHWYPTPVIEKARMKIHPKSSPLRSVKIGKRFYSVRASCLA